jgi:hypothetical protein
MMTEKNDKKLGIIVVCVAVAMVIFAFVVFLTSKNDAGHTGWQVITYQGAWYLTTMAFFALLGVASLVGGWLWYKKTEDEPNKALGGAIVAAIFFSIAFGKGCTDTANDGVTGPKGRLPQTEVKADSTIKK